jgi:hypothetical protein
MPAAADSRHASATGPPIRSNRHRSKSLVQLAPAGIRVKGVPCGDNFIWGAEEAVRNRPSASRSALAPGDPPWIHSMSDLAMFYLDLVEEAGLDRILKAQAVADQDLGGEPAAERVADEMASEPPKPGCSGTSTS